MKQLELFDSLYPNLIKNKAVTGVLLMGSVARDDAAPNSDLDILILGEEEKFAAKTIDGILVEYIYTTPQHALQKLTDNDMELYHYLGSRIAYDQDGELKKLMAFAVSKYNNFVVAQKTKAQISHWLLSTKTKLLSTIDARDTIKINFLTATNSWKVIEALWAVNNKPVPPSGSVLRFISDITIVPFDDWFERLFAGDGAAKATAMLQIIGWVLPKLHITK